MRKLLVGVLLEIVGLSAYLALRPTEAEQYERLRHAQAMNAVAEARAAALAPFEAAALGSGAVVVVLILAGAGYYGVANLRKRALLVYPNSHGLFPLVRVHIGGQVIVHDPNRQPAPTTVYAADGRGGEAVTPVILPELLDATRAAVAQADQAIAQPARAFPAFTLPAAPPDQAVVGLTPTDVQFCQAGRLTTRRISSPTGRAKGWCWRSWPSPAGRCVWPWPRRSRAVSTTARKAARSGVLIQRTIEVVDHTVHPR